MLLCISAVLNRKLWATVQTAKAHYTSVFDPNRMLVPHFNCLNGAFLGTQSATDAAALYMKIHCTPHPFIIEGLGDPFGEKRRRVGRHMPIHETFADIANHTVDLRFGFLRVLFDLFRS